MAKKTISDVSAEIDSREIIEEIPLKDIAAPAAWNVRRNLDENASATEDRSGMPELVNSLKGGQDTPVIVRPMPAHGEYTGKQKYMLVCGFRRYEALTRLAHEFKTTNPTIKAVVRQLTEQDARLLNVRENTARENLGPADLCHGVRKILDMQPGITTAGMGQVLGVSQTYANKLMTIAKDVNQNLVDAWREGHKEGSSARVNLGYEPMFKLAKVARDEQEKAFDAKVVASGADKPKRGPYAWKENAKARAHEHGVYFGKLVKAGALTLKTDFFRKHIDVIMSVHKDASPEDKQKFINSAEMGFLEGQKDVPKKEPKAEKPAKEVKNGKAAQAS